MYENYDEYIDSTVKFLLLFIIKFGDITQTVSLDLRSPRAIVLLQIWI